MDLYKKVLYLLSEPTYNSLNSISRYNKYWDIIKIIDDEQIIKEYEQKKSYCFYRLGAYVLDDNNTNINIDAPAFCFDFQKVNSI